MSEGLGVNYVNNLKSTLLLTFWKFLRDNFESTHLISILTFKTNLLIRKNGYL